MNTEKLKILVDIYNNLLLVSTKGEDSFILVDNLRALQNFILQLNKEMQQEQEGKSNAIE